jgi:formylglycine-generating enzyme
MASTAEAGMLACLASLPSFAAQRAAQYVPSAKPSFGEVQDFLASSRRQQNRERWTWRVLLGAFALVVAVSVFYWRQSREETSRRQAAETHAKGLEAIQKEQRDKADALARQLEEKESQLKGSLSADERKKLLAETQALREETAKAQSTAGDAQKRADEAAKLAAAGGDLKAVNKSLQDTVDQLRAGNAKAEKDLADERARNRTLQDSLNTASAEVTRLNGVVEGLRKPAVSGEPAQGAAPGIQAPVRQTSPPIQTTQPATAAACTGRINSADGLCYVSIPAGSFLMGCSPGDSECDNREKPAHKVTITRGFWMGQTEVTVAAYARYAKATGKSNNEASANAELPVVNVSWDEANGYCKSVGMRLPTEAEWEYAARAGSTASRYGDLDKIAWFNGNSNGKTHEVGQKQPNAWGLYDMLGNVQQWTADWYAPYTAGSQTDPHGPSTGRARVVRGASWNNNSRNARVSNRNRNEPENRNNNVGLRCAGMRTLF